MGLSVAVAAGFAIDELAPGRVVAARSIEDVVAAIRDANAAREAVVLWGGGTRIGIGDPPERYDTALDVSGLRGVVDYEPADLVITVRAGTTLAELAAATAPHRQRWPVEPGHEERATVGGTIASAADGPSRLRSFHPRDWIIGVRAVLGDGTLTHAGGKVVKNVSGYDLTKLYSGSFGTLCALVEVTLKLTALPEATCALRADLVDLDQAYREARALLAERVAVDALAAVSGPVAESVGAPRRCGLFIRLAGPAAAVDRLRSELESRLPLAEADGEVWSRIAALPLDADASTRVTWPAGRFQVHPGDAGGVLYPGLDTLHDLQPHPAEAIRVLRNVVESNGGAAILERAPAALKRAVGAWGTPRLPGAIARELKARFDPNGVLAPGRMPL